MSRLDHTELNSLGRFRDSDYEKVRVEHRGNFIHVYYRDSQWCYNTKRALTFEERLRLDHFLEMERRQMRGEL